MSITVLAIVSAQSEPGSGASITSSIVPFPLYPTTGHPSSSHVTGARNVSRPRLWRRAWLKRLIPKNTSHQLPFSSSTRSACPVACISDFLYSLCEIIGLCGHGI